MGNINTAWGRGKSSGAKKNTFNNYLQTGPCFRYPAVRCYLKSIFSLRAFCRVLAQIYFQKGLISCKSTIWDLGYAQGNVETKKLDLGHVRKSICVINSDLVKAAPEALPATTIGIFPHFPPSQTVLHKGGKTLSLVLLVVRSPTSMVELAAGGVRRGKFDMCNINTSELRTQQQQNQLHIQSNTSIK